MLYTLKDIKNEYNKVFNSERKVRNNPFDKYLFRQFVPQYSDDLKFIGFTKENLNG